MAKLPTTITFRHRYNRRKKLEHTCRDNTHTKTFQALAKMGKTDYSEYDLSHLEFHSISIQWVSFVATKMDHVQFNYCTFTKCNFDLAEFSEAEFYYCTFSNCTFSNTTFINTKVNMCHFGNCQFIGTRLNSVIFDGTNIHNTDLEGAAFNDCEFTRESSINACTLQSVVWRDTLFEDYPIIDVQVLGPIGTREDMLTAIFTEGSMILSTGCFIGTVHEFTAASKSNHGVRDDHYTAYQQAITFMKRLFKIRTGRFSIPSKQKTIIQSSEDN